MSCLQQKGVVYQGLGRLEAQKRINCEPQPLQHRYPWIYRVRVLSMITLKSVFLSGHRLQQLKTSSLSDFIVLTQLCLTERLLITVFSCIYVYTNFTTHNKWYPLYNTYKYNVYMILLKQFLKGNIYQLLIVVHQIFETMFSLEVEKFELICYNIIKWHLKNPEKYKTRNTKNSDLHQFFY